MSDVIRGECVCAIDAEWPTVFAGVPRIGEYVLSKDDDSEVIGTVIQVSHTTTTSHDVGLNRTYTVPYIIVALEVT